MALETHSSSGFSPPKNAYMSPGRSVRQLLNSVDTSTGRTTFTAPGATGLMQTSTDPSVTRNILLVAPSILDRHGQPRVANFSMKLFVLPVSMKCPVNDDLKCTSARLSICAGDTDRNISKVARLALEDPPPISTIY